MPCDILQETLHDLIASRVPEIYCYPVALTFTALDHDLFRRRDKVALADHTLL